MNRLFNNCYEGRKVLVTGHSGFKGAWLCLWLKRLGAEVIGFSTACCKNSSHSRDLRLEMIEEFGDVRNRQRLQEVMAKYQPEIVFHLAAQPLVLSSYEDPLETYDVNVMGTLHLLESIRETQSVCALVNITTDKVYEDIETTPQGCCEEDRLGGHDPYSSSKACSEILTSSYRRSFFRQEGRVFSATARAGNVIGGGDWSDNRLIPDLIRSTITKKPVSIRNPFSVRPWQHVLEPLAGYLMLGQRLIEKQHSFEAAWNFGPARAVLHDVGTIAAWARNEWSAIQFEQQAGGEHQKHEASFLALQSGKANRELGWSQVWELEQAIRHTVQWYRDYSESDRLLTEQQLEQYVEDASDKKLPWTSSDLGSTRERLSPFVRAGQRDG